MTQIQNYWSLRYRASFLFGPKTVYCLETEYFLTFYRCRSSFFPEQVQNVTKIPLRIDIVAIQNMNSPGIEDNLGKVYGKVLMQKKEKLSTQAPEAVHFQ